MIRAVITLLSLVSLIGQAAAAELQLTRDEVAGTIAVFRSGATEALLTQNARPDFRPYIHPIVAPDGRGVLTEYQPGHHKHQTGLYWGFTRLNGRDYFHHPGGDYWRRTSFDIIAGRGEAVSWQTVYELLDQDGRAVMVETQHWEMRADGHDYTLDLVWKGTARQPVTIGKHDYGGLFLRMPWRKGIRGEVVNSGRHRNRDAEGRRDIWLDMGLQVDGRDDLAHIAIFDHPRNGGYPQPWRVDNQLGVGPSRARLGDWTIADGKTETIRHRILVHTGALNDQALTAHWKNYTGQRYPSVLWRLAQEEGRTARFLSPQEAVDAMTVPEGFDVTAFAAEPMITQPMAFCWDDRGRLWIAENRDYESRGHGFSNSGDSRILILEDTDRDGIADTRTVFAEGLAFPAAIAVGFDGLWLGAPPNLVFLPDRDGDDVADMSAAEIRLAGWGIRDRHETLNSFHWGPDGWLYGCQGFATPSRVGKPAGAGRLFRHRDPFPQKIEFEGEPVDINGGVWRYHPVKDRFEVVAHGFSNPWGIDYDAKGNLFITACVIPHMFHVIPGGIYHRQGGKHFNPHVYQDIRTIVDHRHRSAHGGARIYLSDAFPPEHHGRLFMCNIHERAVLSDILTPRGSGFVASHGDDFVKANNAQWVGFSMELGPDGALYALDWHDADICGKDVLNKDTGRVFRIAPKTSRAGNWTGRYDDLSKASDEALVALQTSASSWHARRARLALQNRARKNSLSGAATASLRRILAEGGNPDHRLRALWTLHVIDGFEAGELQRALDDPDEYLRGWAVQLLCEDRAPSAEILARFATMAREDPSPAVRLKLAAALQRLPHGQRWAIAEALLTHAGDADDHNLPKMIWFGIEPLVPAEPTRAMELAAESMIPLVAEFIARRAAEADAFAPLMTLLANTSRPEALAAVLTGLRDGLAGRRGLRPPADWNTHYLRLRRHGGDIARLSAEISQQFGVASASALFLRKAADEQLPVAERNDAIRALAIRQDPALAKALPKLLVDPDVRVEAIRSVAAFDQKPLGRLLLASYATYSVPEKLEAVQALASRPAYGWQLTEAITAGTIPRRDVPSYVARQLRRVVGNGFVEVWGPIDALEGKRAAAYRKYRKLLTPDALANANLNEGRVLFQRSCMACHKLHGEGGVVGPDITGANRASLDYLLDNILNPSGVIQDDYKLVMITTRDGRTLAGNIVAENPRQLTLRIVGQELVLARADIQSRETSPVSLMPEGLLDVLDDSEVIDLVAYLQEMKSQEDP